MLVHTNCGSDGACLEHVATIETPGSVVAKRSGTLLAQQDRNVAGEVERGASPLEVIFDPGATAPVIGLKRWKEMVREAAMLDDRKPKQTFSKRGFLY